ncbi:MAG: primosomal protein N' [Candidatus Gracilibacteria bacterium]|nr:primosomal protein N' [Candidatus Gracilibacteria bacterium]
MYAEIVIDHQLSKLHDSFTYEVPAELPVQLGQIVLVPFGPVRQRGVVVAFKDQVPAEIKGIKNILKISTLEPVLSKEQLSLAWWMSKEYNCTLLHVIKLMLPFEIWKGKQKSSYTTVATLNFPVSELPAKLVELRRAPKQAALLQEIAQQQSYICSSVQGLKVLEQKGLIQLEKKRSWRSLTHKYQPEPEKDISLTAKQQQVLEAFQKTPKQVALLHGITSSGKTEIYLQAIKKVLAEAKQAIYLVPEIALTPQTIQRLVNRFPGQVAVWHHLLSAGEKADEWERIRSGEARVVVGSRSALFTPAFQLGLIVIDEEHEGSYKQDRSPRYHAREVAMQMTKLYQAKLLMGSATPDIGTYYKASQGDYELLELAERIGSANGLPKIEMVDLRDEFKKKNYSYFSDKLQLELANILNGKQQAILFLNRRGSASGLLCRDCGWRSVCPACDITLTVHGPKLLCHYCGHEEAVPVRCPACASVAIKSVGVGTQKVETELKRLFPQARVLRADSDTTSGKTAHEEIYQKFKNYEADILVGTQMIAKGWDLTRVNLVGIIIADIGLHMPDFRASERIFSLITQVAGRAGRGDDPGKVILQTYTPDHEAVIFGTRHDYRGFYENEIKVRQAFHYPPFSRVLTLTYVDQNEDKAKAESKKLAQELKNKLPELEVLGPTPAYPPKVYGKYHFDLLIKLQNEALLAKILATMPRLGWRVDVG